MIKHSRIQISIAITAVLIMVTLFTSALFVAASFNYQFQPSSNYALSDTKVTLHTFSFSGPPYPVRVDWINPQGTQVSCNGGQGVCWDQQVADNGALIWKDFYLPIAGYQRPSGTYTANVYSYQSGIYTIMFSANFSISGNPTNTPTISPTPELPPITDGAELDLTFGVGGKVTTDFGSDWASGYAVALQIDGKIVVTGLISIDSSYDIALARYDGDGSLDTTFGTGGKVTTDFGVEDRGNAVAVQKDGKIVVAGSSCSAYSICDFALARYNSDGSLDTGFGSGGKVTTGFSNSNNVGNAIAMQKDGKIVVAGYSAAAAPAYDFALARYNSDGSLDTGFGTGGKVTTDFGGGEDTGYSVAVQANGKIVVVGYSDSSYPAVDFGLARYNSDGSLDTGFGTGGKVTTDFGGVDFGYSVALQTDGKIVVAGKAGEPNTFALARYNNNGSLDMSFGVGGKVTTEFGGVWTAQSVVLQTDGMIVAAGYGRWGFYLARYNHDGSLDPSFGVGGKATTRFAGGAWSYAAVVQADGMVVVAGLAGDPNTFALARYVAAAPPTPTATVTPTSTRTPSATVTQEPLHIHFYLPLVVR